MARRTTASRRPHTPSRRVPIADGDCEDEGFTCEDGYCYDLSGGSKRASGCTCAGCDVGSYLDDATGGCEACPAGTYQPQAKNTVGASSCIACSAGMDAPEPGSALCCSEDYVLVGQKCAKCGTDDGDYKLTGTKCDTPETRTVATLEIEKGFFRFSPEATVVYPCPEKDDACGGGTPRNSSTPRTSTTATASAATTRKGRSAYIARRAPSAQRATNPSAKAATVTDNSRSSSSRPSSSSPRGSPCFSASRPCGRASTATGSKPWRSSSCSSS